MLDPDTPPDDTDPKPAWCGNEPDGHQRQWHVVVLICDDQQPPAQTTVKTVRRSQVDAEQDFATEVLVGDRIIAVFRHAGDWFAIDGMCSHQGGPVAEGIVRNGCVTCPWHGWQYDLATGVEMINRQPLQESFPVRVVENRVEVRV